MTAEALVNASVHAYIHHVSVPEKPKDVDEKIKHLCVHSSASLSITINTTITIEYDHYYIINLNIESTHRHDHYHRHDHQSAIGSRGLSLPGDFVELGLDAAIGSAVIRAGTRHRYHPIIRLIAHTSHPEPEFALSLSTLDGYM